MATFDLLRVRDDQEAAAAWAALRSELVNARSVEVVLNETDGGFDLRVWWGERRDGSNSSAATPGQDY